MGLHKSLLRSLTVQTDMPPFDQFPKADQVSPKSKLGSHQRLIVVTVSSGSMQILFWFAFLLERRLE